MYSLIGRVPNGRENTITPTAKPTMAKVFADAGAVIREGLAAYVDQVTGRTFPQPENWFGMKDEEYDELVRLLA